ncbi:MAG: 4-hydroxythreonine-4-phosphate dehydrogenase PdxA [Bacteroidales bacterium]|nr:4-hydroxythreonine-4-phosphate dehydrogenase PdxA [Bacteroidales bacterium]
MMQKKIRVGITQGDTNGIGYEVLIKALADSRLNELCTPVVYGSPRLLGFYKKISSGVENFNVHITHAASDLHYKMVNLIPCVSDQFMAEPGKMTEEGAQAAMQSLERAVEDLQAGRIQVLVTAPFNKQSMKKEGFAFPGHTEYLGKVFGVPAPLMILCSHKLRVGIVTGHIPLANVPEELTHEKIVYKIRLLHETLKNDFTIRQPKIAVLGLNPHAGDGGLLGTEEQEVIIPAIEETNREGIMAFGPYAADGFFAAAEYRKFDAVLAMYHDQGLIPFKALSFGQGVNFTAGLPVIRTSPDHGTAYRLAGEDKASAESMLHAIFLACDLFNTRNSNLEIQSEKLHEG